MALEFDTGLALAQRTVLRNAVIAKLAPLLIANGGFLKAVKSISVVVDAERTMTEPDLAELAAALDVGNPIVGVALGRGVGEPTGEAGPHYMKAIDVFFYAMSKNARSDMARMAQDVASLADDTLDPGIETILELVDDLVEGFQIADAAGTIHGLDFVEEDQLQHWQDATIWYARYRVRAERNRRRGKGVTQLLLSLRARHVEDFAATSAEDPLTVESWDPDTLTLVFTDDRPAELAVGDRLTLVAAADGAQQLVTIETLVDADAVTLAVAPDTAPVATDLAYLTQNPIADALST